MLRLMSALAPLDLRLSHDKEALEAGKYDFGCQVRPCRRLSLVEKILGATGVIQPPPSRQNLINMIKRGELEGKKVCGEWIVYEDSFKAWVRDLSGLA